jgi:hypothetical protein
MRRGRGRPRTGSLLTVDDDVFPAVIERLEAELPIASEDVAVALSTNRRTLTEVVARDTGLRWPEWISRISRTYAEPDSDDGGMKRITVTLSDEAFVNLRRRALAELRDPRVVARLIVERGVEPVGHDAPSPQRIRPGTDAA